jgi:hypothetical protein
MNFDAAEKIAAAILYEGYILYPYRPTAVKNRQRWNFGTLYPRSYAEAQRPVESFRLVVECLAVVDADARLDVRISFLQLMGKRQCSAETQQPLSDPSLAWDEAVERTSVHPDLRLKDLLVAPRVMALEMADGTPQGFQAVLKLAAAALPNGACKLRIEFDNRSAPARGAGARREEALGQSFVSAHVLLGISGGQFVSLLDPGEEYGKAAAACCSVGVFPVLVGEEPDHNMMLCSPIILYDYPQIAPESEGDFFDGTEMDEMLTLRVLTLTDAEKQEMRDGDPQARRILERTEALTEEAMLKAHGVVRSLRAIREEAS